MSRRIIGVVLVLVAGACFGAFGILAWQWLARLRDKPNDRVEQYVSEAKQSIEKGDTEKAIALLGAAISIEGASNQQEAIRLLKDSLSAKSPEEQLLRLLNPAPPPRPLVLPEPNWTIEDLIRAYVQAPTWPHKLPFVVNSALVKARMQEHYGAGYRPATFFKIVSSTPALAIGESAKVLVDLGSEIAPCIVVRTEDGLRIDWLASQRIWLAEEEENYRKAHGLVNAHLEVEVLNVKQEYKSAVLNLRVTNRSEARFSYWQVHGEVYDIAGKFLAHAWERGSELSAGDSTVVGMRFQDTTAADVKGWKLRIGRVSIDAAPGRTGDITRYVTLKEKK